MTVEEMLDECKRMTAAKGQDYTTDVNIDRFENFSRCALVSGWFVSDRDKVYATLITVKLARLASLLGRDKEIRNESIKDTFIDLVNYSALWAGDRLETDLWSELPSVSERNDSETACCQIIEISKRLNPKHLADSRDFLSELIKLQPPKSMRIDPELTMTCPICNKGLKSVNAMMSPRGFVHASCLGTDR